MIEQDLSRIATSLEQIAAALTSGAAQRSPEETAAAKKTKTPKAEEPKAEEPKAETPEKETLKAEEPKAETPKTKTPKAQTEAELRAELMQLGIKLNGKKAAEGQPKPIEQAKQYLIGLGLKDVAIRNVPVDKLPDAIAHFESLLA